MLPPFLIAQAAPDAIALKSFLEVFFYLGGSIAALLVAWRTIWPKDLPETPQPLKVQNDPGFVTTTVHEKAIGEIRAELTRHAGRRAEIYETQKQQGAQLAALDQKTDLMNAQLQRQDGKIDRILERLPRS